MIITYKELSSLINDLGFNARALYSVSNNINKHYHKVKIPKNNGEERELSVPDKFMKAIQKRILNVILYHDEISQYAMAYRFGGSTVKNAIPHIGQSVVLKLDIRHFFDCITYAKIKEKVFPPERYSENNRILLSILCSYNGILPQGAPTSPIISNIIMKDFDNLIGGWCRKRKIRYTRYCDDMTFSGEFEPNEVIEYVKIELKKNGFYLNDKKTTVLRDGQKKTVTGIVVNEKPNVSSCYRKEIRKALYYCRKFGVKSHIEHQLIPTDELNYLQKLLGKINYVLSVDSNNNEMKEYREWVISQINKIK